MFIPVAVYSELIDGVAVYDENNNKITESRYAAIKGISQVTFSRILMATPGMSKSIFFWGGGARKLVLSISNQVLHKPACTVTEVG